MATAHEVMRTAASQIGTLESPRGSNRVPYWSLKPAWNGSAWCATFVQWCLKQNGMWYDASLPYYVPSFAAKAKADGTWLAKTAPPRPGDFVVYGTTGYAHIGFVEKANLDGTIQTIEGNTSAGTYGSQSNGDGVYRRRRSRSWVRGFIRPAYVKTNLGGGMTAPINTGDARTLVPYPGHVHHLTGPDDHHVEQIQKRITQLGYPLTADSAFGPKTDAGVRWFQKLKGLTVDGRVGPKTWAALKIYNRA